MGLGIDINYIDTLKKAQELDDLADELEKKCAARIAEIRNSLGRGWTGDAADYYRKKLDHMEKKAKARAITMHYSATVLRVSAEKYRILEMIRF